MIPSRTRKFPMISTVSLLAALSPFSSLFQMMQFVREGFEVEIDLELPGGPCVAKKDWACYHQKSPKSK